MLKARERLLLAALFIVAAALRFSGDLDPLSLVSGGPPTLRADSRRTWTNFSLGPDSTAPPEWQYPPAALEPEEPRCTLVAHLCRAGGQTHPDQVLAMLRFLWTARKVLNCRVAKSFFCEPPERTRGAISPGEFYEIDWSTLGGPQKDWEPLPGGRPQPEYNASLQRPVIDAPEERMPCLADFYSVHQLREPPHHYPASPFQCSAVIVLDPRLIDHTTLRGYFGVPFPGRLPTWLGGSTFTEMSAEVSMLFKPARWVVGLAERVLAALFMSGDKPREWQRRQFDSVNGAGPVNFTKISAQTKQLPRFMENKLPPFLTTHVRVTDYVGKCRDGRQPDPGRQGCGVDWSALGGFLAVQTHEFFTEADRHSMGASRGDEDESMALGANKLERILLVASDADPSELKQLETRVVDAYGRIAGNASAPPVVLFAPLIRKTPQIEHLINGATGQFGREPVARQQRSQVLRSMLDQLFLGCGSKLLMTRGSTFSSRSREMGLHICRQRGRNVLSDTGIAWLPATPPRGRRT